MSLFLEYCIQSSITNVTINGGGTGIEIRNSKLININNVKVNNSKKGIVINNCYDVEVTNTNMHIHNQQYKNGISNLAHSIRLIMFKST